MNPKIVFLFLALAFLATSAFAKVSMRDHFLQKTQTTKPKPACLSAVSKINMQDLIVPEIRDNIQPLYKVQNGNIFYHYTKAKEILRILHSEESDRKRAQKAITEEQSLTSMMKYSFGSEGPNYAGRGIYVAGNPLTSLSYGNIQVSFALSPTTRTLQMNIDKFNTVVDRLLTAKLAACVMDETSSSIDKIVMNTVQQLKTLILEANGVDLFLYDDPMMWYILLNEDLIQETRIVQKNESSELILSMLSNERILELTSSLYQYSSRPRASFRKHPYNPFYEFTEYQRESRNAFMSFLFESSNEEALNIFYKKYALENQANSEDYRYLFYEYGINLLTADDLSQSALQKIYKLVRLDCDVADETKTFTGYLENKRLYDKKIKTKYIREASKIRSAVCQAQ